MTAAALGVSVTLPTLESDLPPEAAAEAGFTEAPPTEVPLEVRAGTQSGTELVLQGQFGNMVSLQGSKIVAVPLEQGTNALKTIDPQLYDLAKIFFG